MTTQTLARAWGFAAPRIGLASRVARGTVEGGENSTPSWRGLPPTARIYVGAVIASGAIAVTLSVQRILDAELWLLATLAVLSVVASIAKINLPVPRSCSTLTICYVIDFTTLLLLGPAAATLTAGLSAWSQCTLRRRQPAPAFQTWFSVGALALTLQSTGFVYAWLGGQPGAPNTLVNIEALAAAATVFFVVNSFLVAAAIGLSTGQPLLRTWTASYLWSWPGHVLGFSIAVIAAAGFGRSGLLLAPIALISLALTYENFKAYVTRFTDSVTDALTGLPNVRYLLSHADQELDRSRRAGLPLAVMLIDLDGFKAINDTHGHRVGDAALRQVAESLQRSIRSYDTCARYGGDEFVAVLPGCDICDAEHRSRTLQEAVAAVGFEPTSGKRVPLRISIGIAAFPEDGNTVEELLTVADARMFEDKETHEHRRENHQRRAAGGDGEAAPRSSEREKQLLEAQRLEAIGQLTGGVAHDFNNVLTAIIGYSDLLLEQIDPDKPIGHDVKEIADAAHRAASLTHQLLAFCRRQDLPMQAVNLNDIVRKTHAMLRRLLSERISIVTCLADDLAATDANPTQLEQILVNLCVNARDAMATGGTLMIETRNVDVDAQRASAHQDQKGQKGQKGRSPGRYVELCVTDSGVGMPPEVQAKIFDLFFTTKAAGRGTGLGLASVKNIVTQSNGYIDVDSEPGRGTTFRVGLPVSAAAVASTMAPTDAAAPIEPGGETILLVEDEEAVREFATLALKRHGYRVLEAPSAEAALFLLRRLNLPVHMLLTDVVLPGIDGCELAHQFESDRPNAPILFTTGYPEGLKNTEGLQNSPQILQKPFSARALLAKTRELLDQRAA